MFNLTEGEPVFTSGSFFPAVSTCRFRFRKASKSITRMEKGASTPGFVPVIFPLKESSANF